MSDARELRNIEVAIDKLRNVFERHFRIKPATQILIYGGNMGLNITAGAAALLVQLIPLPAGSVFDSPADLGLTADDPNVVIAENAADPSGTTFNVSTPASDTAASFNLNATGMAGGVAIKSDPTPVTITPAGPPPPPPPNPATSIGIVAASPAAGRLQAAKDAKAATDAPVEGKGRAPAR